MRATALFAAVAAVFLSASAALAGPAPPIAEQVRDALIRSAPAGGPAPWC